MNDDDGNGGSVSRRGKDRLTAKLPPELINELRNYVWWTRGETLAGATEKAIREFLARHYALPRSFDTPDGKRIVKEAGEKYPERLDDLTPGRPPG